jgi:hypothetical protein
MSSARCTTTHTAIPGRPRIPARDKLFRRPYAARHRPVLDVQPGLRARLAPQLPRSAGHIARVAPGTEARPPPAVADRERPTAYSAWDAVADQFGGLGSADDRPATLASHQRRRLGRHAIPPSFPGMSTDPRRTSRARRVSEPSHEQRRLPRSAASLPTRSMTHATDEREHPATGADRRRSRPWSTGRVGHRRPP